MILLRTHSNRWVARARRAGVALGLITWAADLPRPVFKTVRLDARSGDRALLRDADTLEEAFAVLLAGIERSRVAADRAQPLTGTSAEGGPLGESAAA